MIDLNVSINNALRDIQSDRKTELCNIMTTHKSDKGNGWHNYTVLYHHLFSPIRYKPLSVFEMGLGTNNVNIKSNMGGSGRFGASLYGWEQYFPNALIFGADIDADLSVVTHRIKTFYADQTSSASLKTLWANFQLQNRQFDIIVDDGLHEFHAGKTMFENSFHKLKSGGIYVIEDIHVNEKHLFEAFAKQIRDRISSVFDAFVITLPNSQNQYDNTLMLVFKS